MPSSKNSNKVHKLVCKLLDRVEADDPLKPRVATVYQCNNTGFIISRGMSDFVVVTRNSKLVYCYSRADKKRYVSNQEQLPDLINMLENLLVLDHLSEV